MSSNPKITVLIPTFNRAEYIAECLDSILSQTLPAFQVIVVNDGSTDRTRHILEPYMDRIDYFETNQIGKPSAINHGLERVKGDYLWIFDDDDVALSDALERFVEPLEQMPQHGFSHSTFFVTANELNNNRIGKVLYELKIPDLEKRGFLIPLLENNFLGGAALFARTSCYKAVGLFDPRLLRSQDYEMAIRLAERFTGVRVPGSATFHYRQHDGIRGNLKDRFSSNQRLSKWLEYDQFIFRRIYREYPLEKYLPSNNLNSHNKRQALLQRLVIMANKILVQEAMNDLRALAELDDPRPFSAEERIIVRTMVEYPYYKVGNLIDQRIFSAELHKLSSSSKVARSLKREILFAVLKLCKEEPTPRRAYRSLIRIINLCS